MKSQFEMGIMLLITGVTNLALLPAVYTLHTQKKSFEGQWHRLDNIGSIMSFICWIVYLMDIKKKYVKNWVLHGSLGCVLILQEYSPWDERCSAGPILVMALLGLLKCLRHQHVPKYDYQQLSIGFLCLIIALCCFIRGLDDETDPYRFFHGCWHLFVGIAAYFNWRVLPYDKNNWRNKLG